MSFASRCFAVALLVLLVACAQAGIVCRQKDCSDVVGDYMTKDNRMGAHVINNKEHLQYMEQSRLHRLDIQRRERAAASL